MKLFPLIVSLGLAASAARADSSASHGSRKIDFNREILPILSDRCFHCHGPDASTRKAGLRLDTQKGAFADLGGYRAIVAGQPEKSEIFRRMITKDADDLMPPPDSHKQVSPAEIELVKTWILQGANWQPHWAFSPPERPRVPRLRNPAWARNAIDYFVGARLDAAGLTPAPPASKEALIRRVTLDLTGLPPTPAEVDAFVADARPDAYERLVERLLASPRYGEHQARFWLDAVRYGDTHGLHFDNRRAIWPYRDWVVRAFDQNMPFDRFTIEQLAGDLLPEPRREQLVATGFLRCNMTTNEGGVIVDEAKVHLVRDRVETFATVFLGLTAGCAACHDHKYDPFSQKDFYRLSAYFDNGTDEVMDQNIAAPYPFLRLGTPAQEKELARLDRQLAAVDKEIRGKLDRIEYDDPLTEVAVEKLLNPSKRRRGKKTAEPPKLTDRMDSFLLWAALEASAGDASKLPDPVKQAVRKEAKKRNEADRRLLRDHFFTHVWTNRPRELARLHEQRAPLAKRRAELDDAIPKTLVFEERDRRDPTHVLARGEYDHKGEKVAPGTPSVLPAPPDGTEPNRLGLAKWLLDGENPLTARVTVNRFWQQHFGVGLVKTAWDFGVQGEWPSHPELLDWLATHFVATGWNVKALHRLIVNSATYRQSAEVTKPKLKVDPENRLLARGPRFRLDGEVLRDSALFVSGLLVEKPGGEGVKPYEPGDLWYEVAFPGSDTKHFKVDTGPALYRRSLYTFWKRTSPPPAMMVFDAPSREYCNVKRERTNTPLQALVLMNDPQYVEAARKLAERILRDGGATTEARLQFAFRRVTARRADGAEAKVLSDLLASRLAAYAQSPAAAESLLKVGESPADRRWPAAELAAWTMVASAILNLDEAVTN